MIKEQSSPTLLLLQCSLLWILLRAFTANYCSKSNSRKQVIVGESAFDKKDFQKAKIMRTGVASTPAVSKPQPNGRQPQRVDNSAKPKAQIQMLKNTRYFTRYQFNKGARPKVAPLSDEGKKDKKKNKSRIDADIYKQHQHMKMLVRRNRTKKQPKKQLKCRIKRSEKRKA